MSGGARRARSSPTGPGRNARSWSSLKAGPRHAFWQSPRTVKQPRPDGSLPTSRAGGLADLEIIVDTWELYAYRFTGQAVTTVPRAPPLRRLRRRGRRPARRRGRARVHLRPRVSVTNGKPPARSRAWRPTAGLGTATVENGRSGAFSAHRAGRSLGASVHDDDDDDGSAAGEGTAQIDRAGGLPGSALQIGNGEAHAGDDSYAVTESERLLSFDEVPSMNTSAIESVSRAVQRVARDCSAIGDVQPQFWISSGQELITTPGVPPEDPITRMLSSLQANPLQVHYRIMPEARLQRLIPDEVATEEQMSVTLAEAVQDEIHDETWGHPWPPCPAHRSHPLWPNKVDGIAVWECHVDRSIRFPIGGLVQGL